MKIRSLLLLACSIFYISTSHAADNNPLYDNGFEPALKFNSQSINQPNNIDIPGSYGLPEQQGAYLPQLFGTPKDKNNNFKMNGRLLFDHHETEQSSFEAINGAELQFQFNH